MLKILDAQTGNNLDQVRILWRQFAEFLKVSLAEYSEQPEFKEYFQKYEHEIGHLLPGRFGGPKGCLLVAEYQDATAGCVGLKDSGGGICEMRRLFVEPQYRGSGIGKALAKAAIEQGRNIGYTSMRLNTNQRMVEAIGLYKSLGFAEIGPYEHFSIDGMVYMELKLV